MLLSTSWSPGQLCYGIEQNLDTEEREKEEKVKQERKIRKKK